MRKNKMMRLASMLLVLCLLTTSVISGTFAKYITTDQQLDTARVAKWGVVASIEGNLFGATYDQAEKIISWNETANSVSSAQEAAMIVAPGTKNEAAMIVAPGTKNEAALTLSISGKPEVSTKVTYDAAEDENGKDYANSDIYLVAGTYGVMVPYNGDKTAETCSDYYIYKNGGYAKATKDNCEVAWYELQDEVTISSDYHPLVWSWTVKKAEKTTETGKKTFKDMEVAVRNTFPEGDNALQFAPNSLVDTSITIGWEWAFGDPWNDQNKTSDEIIRPEDKCDTILGNMMAYFVDKTAGDANEKVVVLHDGVYKNVGYTTVKAGTNGANDVHMVKIGTNGTDYVACLTAAFNARLTVEQVD